MFCSRYLNTWIIDSKQNKKNKSAHQQELRGLLVGRGPPVENHCCRELDNRAKVGES